jgi:hypothetical protein
MEEQSDDLMLSTSRFEREFSDSTTSLKSEIDFEGNAVKSDIPLGLELDNEKDFDPKQIKLESLDKVEGAFLLRNVLSADEWYTACFLEFFFVFFLFLS